MLFSNTQISSLTQGSHFDGMQEKIIEKNLPGIALLEKTTMPGINYLQESLENMDKKKSLKCTIASDVVLKDNFIKSLPKGQRELEIKKINSACQDLGRSNINKCGVSTDGLMVSNVNWCNIEDHGSLEKMDKKEFKKLEDLETEFSKKLSEYIAIYKSRTSEFLKPKKCIPVGNPKTPSIEIDWDGKSTMKNCSDFTSTIGPYKSSSGSWLQNDCNIGFNGGNKACNGITHSTSSNTYWGKKACSLGTELKSKTDVNGCGDRNETMCEKKKKCKLGQQGNANDIDHKLSFLNTQLMNLSKKIWERTEKIHSKDVKIQQQLNKNRAQLKDKMKKLKLYSNNINKLNNSHTTLDGRLEDNRLQTTAVYLRYIAWFVSAMTVGSIAIHRAFRQ